MENNKGFTLVELLAVVVILGILMMIAIPNTISMIDKNKTTNYIENAKTFISLVQSKAQTDKSLEVPLADGGNDASSVLIVTLDYLNTTDLETDPHGGLYSKERSFVAVSYESSEYKYYVHLVSCADGDNCGCDDGSCSYDDLNLWRGIQWATPDNLNGDSRYDYVESSGVDTNLINNLNSVFPGKQFCIDNLGCS